MRIDCANSKRVTEMSKTEEKKGDKGRLDREQREKTVYKNG